MRIRRVDKNLLKIHILTLNADDMPEKEASYFIHLEQGRRFSKTEGGRSGDEKKVVCRFTGKCVLSGGIRL
jgi:hypothetical protein